MCGIAGIVNNPGQYINKDHLIRMSSVIRHRGPDDEGFALYDDQTGKITSYSGADTNISLGLQPIANSSGRYSVGFAFRRLSILDLSEAGHQPMLSEDHRFMMVFNGEIYNYQEIAAELTSLGFAFRSQSDSEVVLASYIAWGDKCVKKFNGMWSFCIYDTHKKLLFASRDRFGVKPFYYSVVNSTFVFASEIKQIVKLGNLTLEVDDQVAYQYLTSGKKDYSNHTFFKGIFQLEPGFNLTYLHGEINTNRYWDFSVNDSYKKILNNNIEGEFHNLFNSSVKYRFQADVPVGVALSGGLDSSSISVVANTISPNTLKTFTVVYDNPNYDERMYAEAVSKLISSDMYECRPNVQDFINDIDEIIYHMEEPFRSISTYSQWCLMKGVKQNGVTVLLEGQGADELLGGYHWYYEDFFDDLISNMMLSKFIFEAYLYSKNYNCSIYFVIYTAVKKFVKRRLNKVYGFKKKSKLFAEYRETAISSYDVQFKNALGRQLNFGLRYLIRELLNYGDKTSMRFSVENRVPFLDYRLVEFVTKLPLSNKISHGKTKYLLRNSLKSILPVVIYNRFDKLGFATPQEIWQRNELKAMFKDEIIESGILDTKYFNSSNAKSYVNDYFAGVHNDFSFVWRCYNFSKWSKAYCVKIS